MDLHGFDNWWGDTPVFRNVRHIYRNNLNDTEATLNNNDPFINVSYFKILLKTISLRFSVMFI
jgi:hypothetical protein